MLSPRYFYVYASNSENPSSHADGSNPSTCLALNRGFSPYPLKQFLRRFIVRVLRDQLATKRLGEDELGEFVH